MIPMVANGEKVNQDDGVGKIINFSSGDFLVTSIFKLLKDNVIPFQYHAAQLGFKSVLIPGLMKIHEVF